MSETRAPRARIRYDRNEERLDLTTPYRGSMVTFHFKGAEAHRLRAAIAVAIQETPGEFVDVTWDDDARAG